MTTIACVTKVLPNTAVAGSQFNNGRSYVGITAHFSFSF
jgi:hypothetical protein